MPPPAAATPLCSRSSASPSARLLCMRAHSSAWERSSPAAALNADRALSGIPMRSSARAHSRHPAPASALPAPPAAPVPAFAALWYHLTASA